jgi:hypothetical protein
MKGFERLSPALTGLLIVYSLAKELAQAASKPFWNDEVITWTLSHQPSMSVVWTALERGADGSPPGFYLIERLFSHLATNAHIALRLPSILAFCCTLACVFVAARKRAGAALAATCMAILFTTVLYDTYAIEARPYGLSVASIAFAVVCYQRTPKFLWTLFLGLSLILAAALHYYAVFALAPFAAAEAVYYLLTRKVRLGVWLTILCGGLPMIVYWPLLNEQRQAFGPHFWGHPKLFTSLASYGSFLHLPVSVGLSFACILALGLILKWQGSERRSVPAQDTLLHEPVLLLCMLGMPFVVFLIARVTHGGFLDRYVLWAALPMVLIPAYIIPRYRARTWMAVTAFVFLSVASQEALSLYSLRGGVGRFVSPTASVERLVGSADSPELPVVVGNDNDYVQLSYYASPEWAKRFLAVTDPEGAVAYIGTDTADRELPVLAGYSSLRVYDFTQFAAAHREFLLYSTSEAATAGPFGYYDWWIPRLLRDGYSLRVVAAEGNRRVYLVTNKR